MDALLDEVESLEAILMDDVHITRNPQSGVPEVIETTVLPVIGEDEEQQYVCLTLQVLPPPDYPEVSPNFKLLRPRGLDDARLEAIRAACITKLQESLGFPVVFDLIEVVREHLSGSNLPSGQCVVCLYGFSEGDDFTRTECFHYLHSYCLGRHLNALRRNYQEEHEKLPAWLQKTSKPFQAACPVCREIIKDDSDNLKCAMPPAELQNAPEFKLTEELRELQQRMSELFLQQKSRGGIIDLEAEGGTVISIETEAEMRTRLHITQDETENAFGETNNSSDSPSRNIGGINSIRNCDSPLTGSRILGAEQLDAACAKPTASTTSFAPVVQQTHRITTDPTNNNYQHNRRHYRGGRRHQQHHHHHRDRERERERYEHNHLASHSSNNASPGGGGVSTAASNAGPASVATGKQHKAQAASGGHTR